MFTSKDILSQLDKCNENYNFPMLDNGYIYLAKVKMSCYRDDSRWVIIIERVGTNTKCVRHDRIATDLYIFGNCLNEEPGLNSPIFVTDDASGMDIFAKDNRFINPKTNEILVRGKKIQIPHDPNYYKSKGIILENPNEIQVYEFLRAIIPEYKELFYATEKEIRERIPKELPLILELEDYYHPDLCNDEKPSDTETFQMIAKVLEIGKKELYNPTLNPNTYWKKWSEGGNY